MNRENTYPVTDIIFLDEERNFYNIPDAVNNAEDFQILEDQYGAFSFKPDPSSFAVQQDIYKVNIKP